MSQTLRLFERTPSGNCKSIAVMAAFAEQLLLMLADLDVGADGTEKLSKTEILRLRQAYHHGVFGTELDEEIARYGTGVPKLRPSNFTDPHYQDIKCFLMAVLNRSVVNDDVVVDPDYFGATADAVIAFALELYRIPSVIALIEADLGYIFDDKLKVDVFEEDYMALVDSILARQKKRSKSPASDAPPAKKARTV